jgi:hypothetical protein
LAFQCQSCFHCSLYASFVYHLSREKLARVYFFKLCTTYRQGSRNRSIKESHIGIHWRSKLCARSRKKLGLSGDLGVDFQADDSSPFLGTANKKKILILEISPELLNKPFIGSYRMLQPTKTHRPSDGATPQSSVHFATGENPQRKRQIEEKSCCFCDHLVPATRKGGVACLHEQQLAAVTRAPAEPLGALDVSLTARHKRQAGCLLRLWQSVLAMNTKSRARLADF